MKNIHLIIFINIIPIFCSSCFVTNKNAKEEIVYNNKKKYSNVLKFMTIAALAQVGSGKKIICSSNSQNEENNIKCQYQQNNNSNSICLENIDTNTVPNVSIFFNFKSNDIVISSPKFNDSYVSIFDLAACKTYYHYQLKRRSLNEIDHTTGLISIKPKTLFVNMVEHNIYSHMNKTNKTIVWKKKIDKLFAASFLYCSPKTPYDIKWNHTLDNELIIYSEYFFKKKYDLGNFTDISRYSSELTMSYPCMEIPEDIGSSESSSYDGHCINAGDLCEIMKCAYNQDNCDSAEALFWLTVFLSVAFFISLLACSCWILRKVCTSINTITYEDMPIQDEEIYIVPSTIDAAEMFTGVVGM